MEWAYATGHSKKYASSGWASYDSHFFRWAERAGYAIDLASQHELHFEPEILDGYDCVVFVGHDEYWTWEMRDAVDAYVERGGHAARFAGNFMWQTRLEDEGARQVCYKYRARAEDPAYRGGDVTPRHQFLGGAGDRPARAPRPSGSMPRTGVYAGWGGCAPRGVRGFPIYRPEHWAFAGTGIYYGDMLGADSHVFGYEVDGLDYDDPRRPALADGRQRRAGWPANPGARHGLARSRRAPTSRSRTSSSPTRTAASSPRRCIGEPSDEQSRQGQARQRHDRQFPARQGRGVPCRKLRMGRRPAAQRRDGRARHRQCARPLSRKA